MYINNFGQIVKAETVNLSVPIKDFVILSTVALRFMTQTSDITVKFDTHGTKEKFLVADIEGVKDDTVERVQRAIGFDLVKDGDKYIVQNGSRLTEVLLSLIVDETAKYSLLGEDDILIEMDFDKYIKNTFRI